jgi:hypothetical protein
MLMNIATLFGSLWMSNDYNNGNSMMTTDAATAGIVMYLIFVSLAIVAVVYVVSSLLLGRIFAKAGEKSWKAWVPVYNNWVMLELGDQKGFWAILAFIPLINIVSAVYMFIAMYYIGLKLHKEGAFVLLAIFLPLVWMIWLAVDNSTWEGKSVQTKVTPK